MTIKGKIYGMAKIVGIERLMLGERSQIDDFCFINTGISCEIGFNVHISSFTTIIGGGVCKIGDFAGLSAGCRVITGTDDFMGHFLTNPTVPAEYKSVHLGRVVIGRHAIVGTNSIILPDVVIGDGCSVGAGSVIRKNLEAWTVYATIKGELRPIKSRPKDEILMLEEAYMNTLQS